MKSAEPTIPSAPSQFASRAIASAGSLADTNVQAYSQPFAALPSRSTKPGSQT